MPTEPNPSTWTLRLKHHKTTILLHIDPLQTLASLKEDLLLALQQTCPHQTLHGKQLPSAAGAFAIAKPRDPLDVAAKGWERLPAGKKAERESVKAAGVRDNAVLAFRWDEKGKKAVLGADEGDGDGEVGLGFDGDGGEDEEWDVVLPSFEDQYGVENEGDLGMQREFNG